MSELVSGLKIIKGQVVYCKNTCELEVHKKSFIVVENGKVEGIYQILPDTFSNYPVQDYGDRIIIPGFVDLHLHAAQFLQCGMGMTKKLLEWLEDYTFNLERSFQNPEFAKKAYTLFAEKLLAHGTLRSAIFASSSTVGTEQLHEALKRVGVGAYVGKVAMDCNAPDYILESASDVISGTLSLIEKYGDDALVKPIITPRFVPTCSSRLLGLLGKLANEKGLPVQSHLNECRDEIDWVKKLFPDDVSYSHVYEKYGLFGTTPTLMAHCVHMLPEELALIKERDVMMVHCPDSNINVRSGIMPVRKMMQEGIAVGLGSDIAGGHKLGMNEAIVRAVQLSKLRNLDFPEEEPLTIAESFYLATKGGGKFFGKTGSFEKGYFFDALVLEDEPILTSLYTIEDRLEKFLYTGDDRNIIARYVEGNKL